MNALDTEEYVVQPFPTRGDRFGAGELNKRLDKEGYTRKGFTLQVIAAGWHHKSDAQLAELGDKVGRERIQIIHGKLDRMITFPHAETLLKGLNGQRGEIRHWWVQGVGHVVPLERRDQFREYMEEMIEKTEGMRT